MIIPNTPKNPPNRRREKITQKAGSPVVPPRIFGPITFPSSCCIAIISMINHIVFEGSTRSIMIADGIAPINGPKNGITFVSHTITVINAVLGIRSSVIDIKQIMPIIMESSIFPLIKPPNVLSISEQYDVTFSTLSSLSIA